MKPIKLTNHQWMSLRLKLREDYNPSITLMRSAMKDKLGFTPRNHKEYNPQTGTTHSVYLDFFDDAKRTMFMLKYSEYFNASSQY